MDKAALVAVVVSLVVASGCSEDSSGTDGNSNAVTPGPGASSPGPAASTPGPGTPTAEPTNTTMPSSTATPAPTPTQTAPTPSETPAAGGGGGSAADPGGVGGMGGSGEPGPSVALPADETEASMTAFITTEGYKGEGWVAETEAPREQSMSVSPHGRVRVYQSQIVLDSLAAGNGGIGSESGVPHPSGSMAIKEMYDEADGLVGIAALYKYGDGSGDWAMWCYGPADRCATSLSESTADAPFYGLNPLDCGACHGGNIFTNPHAEE